MFRIFLSAISFLCLITTGLLLWQSHTLPAHFPHGSAGWMAAWFSVFENPVITATLLTGSFLLAVTSACVSELLLGFLLSLFSAVVSIFCMVGFLGNHYPNVSEFLEKWVR